MNSNTEHSEAPELLRELLQMQRALPLRDNSAPLLAVARLVPGLDMEAWRKMADAAALNGWCALEMTDDGRYRCQWQDLADALPACGSLDASLQLSPFMRQLDKEILRAKRGQSEVSLILFAAHGGRESTAEHAAATTESNAKLAALLRENAECCDSMGSMGAGRCALLLPGAGMYKAQNVAETVCARLNGEGNVCAAGIATAKGKGAEAGALVRQAAAALDTALTRGLTVLVADTPKLPEFPADTLVQCNEKRFLFGGEC